MSTAKQKKGHAEYLLNQLRGHAKHHLWGTSQEGRAVVEPLIAEARAAWVKENPGRKPTDVNKHINIYNKIRSEQFRLLPKQDQEHWAAEAKKVGRGEAADM